MDDFKNTRQVKRIFICGAQETGKTAVSIQFINKTIQSPFNKHVLVMCPDADEDSLSFLPEITCATLGNLKHNRIVFDEDNDNFYNEIKAVFKHGLLVIDDGAFFCSHGKNGTFEKLIGRARQRNSDIIFSCHGMTAIPRALWKFFTDLLLFYTADSLPTARNNIPEFEIKQQWQLNVNTHVKKSRQYHYFKHYKLMPSVRDFINGTE